ncbi:MAG: IS21 family transposase [Deltaproteobacteria bacterium]|nr:IS21 family transposase [Deltaproteobacteria bacterium]
MEGKTQEAAAAAAGMSVRSARAWQSGGLPSETKAARTWRTRPDPFAEVWASKVVPLLELDKEGVLEARTILEVLNKESGQAFADGQVRTLQRRMRDWRALQGPEREVMFPQQHVPGREAAVDFTHATELGVTVRGVLLVHLLFEFVLSFSGWTWVCLAFGETFEALLGGLQGAFWSLGGLTEVVRSDNLSAATHELKETRGRSLTERFRKFLEHYGLRSTRIQPGESHQNGVVENRNYRTKNALAQALVVRGSKDFDSSDDYIGFVREVVGRANARISAEKIVLERAALRPLPPAAMPSYTPYRCKVRNASTIRVNKRTYSVPSRLMGHWLNVRQHADVIEVYYGSDNKKPIETMPRLRGDATVRIDYRHVIWSLVRKPGAFARYRYREELFPSIVFRQAYDALRARRGDRADIEYVRILHLAASTMEAEVEKALASLVEAGSPFDYAAVQAIASPIHPTIPMVDIPAPDLAGYDALLMGDAA